MVSLLADVSTTVLIQFNGFRHESSNLLMFTFGLQLIWAREFKLLLSNLNLFSLPNLLNLVAKIQICLHLQ